MAEVKKVRLSNAARQYNVGAGTLVEFLEKKGIRIVNSPSTILEPEALAAVEAEFGGKGIEKVDISDRMRTLMHDAAPVADREKAPKSAATPKAEPAPAALAAKPEAKPASRPAVEAAPAAEPLAGPKILGKIDLDKPKPAAKKPAAEEATEPAAAPKPVAKPVAEPAPKKPAAPKKPEEIFTTPVENVAAPKVLGKIDLDKPKAAAKPAPAAPEVSAAPEAAPVQEALAAPAPRKEPEIFRAPDAATLAGPKILGKIELPVSSGEKGKRARIKKGRVDVANTPGSSRPASTFGAAAGRPAGGPGKKGPGGPKPAVRPEVSDEEVQKQIKETLARLTSKGGKSKSAKYRRDKRDAVQERIATEQQRAAAGSNTLQVTEFVTVSELAAMMDVPVTDVIMACMNLGLMVSINQRLDAEALVIVAEEFGYKVEFVSVEIQEAIEEEQDNPEDYVPRPPIVTVMGHVDHGKTSLLDYIRKANVIAGEAGGITQHIGAYSVKMEDGRKITFLDTPGHEAFTAMRARGAKVTDVAIIIIAADDSVMPQTIEAINHASAAGVPIVFAINKIDKAGANAEKIKEQLSGMNYLVEDWGGKFQSQEIAAKTGLNVDKLLEKVLLEAEMLDLKANPDKRATGTVVESTLDKGRGYVSTVLVSSGTLHVGDVMLSGIYTGRVKAMFDEHGRKLTEAPPATPAVVLGLNGAPQAGDNFNVMEDDKSARDIANKREQLQRMQGLRTQKHITLDEIGRRIAVGNFKELNIIVKGDVDGSIEALTDSLVKLSNEEVQVNVIHKAVGAVSESDILLAAASNAIVIGFQVRPSASARKLAEKEEIEIRLYSIIYDAINEIKDAIEGMLAPETREEIVCSVEVMETFKITKVGTVAGCLVREGKITRQTPVRVIRDGIVVYTGRLGSLKRFKDDAKEVTANMECGLNIENYNDIKVGDIIEGYEQVEVARKL